MIKVLLNGCNGSMGIAITNLLNTNTDIKIAAGVSPSGVVKSSYPVYKSIFECKDDFDIIVDFSTAESLNNLLRYALDKGYPLIIGTTGYTEQQLDEIKKASQKIPIFYSANTSVGINVMLMLIKKAAQKLGNSFDIEIIEKHHNKKYDAPSGTALSIVNAINEVSENRYNLVFDRHSLMKKRSNDEIGIHSVRGGTLVGEHSIIFAGNDEFLEIKHTALSKNIFAEGVIKAIMFMFNQTKGFYTMQSLIES